MKKKYNFRISSLFYATVYVCVKTIVLKPFLVGDFEKKQISNSKEKKKQKKKRLRVDF